MNKTLKLNKNLFVEKCQQKWNKKRLKIRISFIHSFYIQTFIQQFLSETFSERFCALENIEMEKKSGVFLRNWWYFDTCLLCDSFYNEKLFRKIKVFEQCSVIKSIICIMQRTIANFLDMQLFFQHSFYVFLLSERHVLTSSKGRILSILFSFFLNEHSKWALNHSLNAIDITEKKMKFVKYVKLSVSSFE